MRAMSSFRGVIKTKWREYERTCTLRSNNLTKNGFNLHVVQLHEILGDQPQLALGNLKR
jgi:transposase-like protein